MADQMGTPPPATPAPGGPSGPRASFGIRLVAALIDGIGLSIVGWIIRQIVGDVVGGLVGLVVGIAYFVYLEGSASGQTVGKRALGIRVLDLRTSGRIDYTKAFIRYIGRYVSAIPCLLGFFWMLWDTEKQTWHDKIAGTVVVPAASYPVEEWPG